MVASLSRGLRRRTRPAREGEEWVKIWQKLLLIFAMIGVVFAALFWMDERRKATMTAEASGTVTGVVLEADDESSSLDQTQVSYRFDAAGTPAEGRTGFPGDKVEEWPAGRTVRICYNPEDPAASEIRDAGTPCG